jgi:hypothetical protein
MVPGLVQAVAVDETFAFEGSKSALNGGIRSGVPLHEMLGRGELGSWRQFAGHDLCPQVSGDLLVSRPIVTGAGHDEHSCWAASHGQLVTQMTAVGGHGHHARFDR